MKILKSILICTFLFSGLCSSAQKPMNSAEKKLVIHKVEKLMDSIYVFPEVAAEAISLIKKRQQRGNYIKILNPKHFADVLTDDLKGVTKDLHIHLSYDPEAIARKKKEETNIDQAAGTLESLKSENFGFRNVKILEGNIGYLDLRIFIDPEYAGETAIGAMNFLSNSDAIIFDLRNNRGGSPAMIQLLQSYLFGSEPVHLNNFYSCPEDKHTQTWTLPYVPGERKPDVPVYVLTSNKSFSAAEEFAYNIKNLERGTLIGETTGGAANPGDTHVIDNNFAIFIPSGRVYSPVTGTNWEGVGVKPHIQVPQEEALQLAHIKALEELSEKNRGADKRETYQWHLDNLYAEKDPIVLSSGHLKSLTGTFGENKVLFKEGELFYQKPDPKQVVKLIPLEQYEFAIKNEPSARIEFSRDGTTLKEVYLSGKERLFRRE